MDTHTLIGSRYEITQGIGVQAFVACFQVLICLYIYTVSQPLHFQLSIESFSMLANAWLRYRTVKIYSLAHMYSHNPPLTPELMLPVPLNPSLPHNCSNLSLPISQTQCQSHVCNRKI